MRKLLQVITILAITFLLFTIEYKFRIYSDIDYYPDTKDVQAGFIKNKLNDFANNIGDSIEENEYNDYKVLENYSMSRLSNLRNNDKKDILEFLSEISLKIYEYKGYEI